MSTFTKEYNYNFLQKLFDDIASNDYYAFVANPFRWDDDFLPPRTNESDKVTFFDPRNELLFGKRITKQEIYFLIEKKTWQPNKVYVAYTNDDPDLFESDFYVINRNFCVYKCIFSPGTPSTEEPIAIENTIFTMGDNYSWKFMYRLKENEYDMFFSTNFIPVKIDNDVRSNTVEGSIESVTIINEGSNYSTFNDGQVTGIAGSTFKKFRIQDSQIEVDTAPDFYKDSTFFVFSNNNVYSSRITKSTANSSGKFIETELSLPNVSAESSYIISPTIEVDGDGTGFEAYLMINKTTKKIDSVEIISNGQSYTYADLFIIENPNYGRGGIVKAELSPKGGHGFNPIVELGSNKIGIVTSFIGDENNRISDNVNFRVAGLIKNPKEQSNPSNDFTDVAFNQILECLFSLNSEDMIIRKGDYIKGENGLGRVLSAKSGILRMLIYYGSFSENDSFVIRNKSPVVSGRINDIIRYPDINKYEGEIYFVQHFQPIERVENSKEDFKLIIEI